MTKKNYYVDTTMADGTYYGKVSLRMIYSYKEAEKWVRRQEKLYPGWKHKIIEEDESPGY